MAQPASVAERAPQDASDQDEERDSQKVLASAGWGMAGGILQGAIRFATSLLTARALGAELLGVFHLSNRVSKIGTLFSLSGQDDAVLHFVARHRGTGELEKARGAFYVSLAIGSGLSVLMGVTVYLLAPWISNETFHNQAMVPVIEALSIAVPLSVLGGILSAGLRGTRDVRAAVLTQAVVIPLARLLLFAALLVVGWRLFGLVAALLGSLAIGLVYAGWHLRRSADWMQPGIRPRFEVGSVVRFSLPLVLLSLIDYANNSSDILIVGHYHGAAAAGVYGQAVRVLTILKVPVSALSALFVPLCAELYGTRSLERLRAMFQATASCGIRIAVPLAFGAFLFARPVMALFGPDFTCGALTLAILSTIVVSNCYAMLAGYAVYMSGRSWLVTLNQAFLALASIVLYLLLVPGFGIEGAAWARTLAWGLWAALILLETAKLFGFRPVSRDMLKGLAAGAASFLAVWLLQRFEIMRENPFLVVLSGAAFVALYVRLVCWLGLTQDESFVLGQLGRKLRGALRKLRLA
jgi:O-antigen/teichoic acid export membrane protein